MNVYGQAASLQASLKSLGVFSISPSTPCSWEFPGWDPLAPGSSAPSPPSLGTETCVSLSQAPEGAQGQL